MKYPDMYIDRVLKKGDSFGEVALGQHVLRTATIVCKEDCEFGVLRKSSFQRILKDHFDAIMEENINLLKKQSLFEEWTEPELEQFYLHMKEQSYGNGQIIYEENDPANEFYFVKEGAVEVKTRKK
jgi:CRP-like cAMP-binding protein